MFYGCTGLTEVSIPANVTSIGNYAFSGCKGLTEVTFENTIGWKQTGKDGTIDVSVPTTNATNLKNIGANSWGGTGIERQSQ